jgi:hypothetical protein
MEKAKQQIDVDGMLYNVYYADAARCGVTYPDANNPCEPNPTPCDPAVIEVIETGSPPNTITITASIPGFSRYFEEITNYTGSLDTAITTESRPNTDPDPLISADPEIDPTTVPAFRGTCYSVIRRMNITKWAGTLPQFEAQIRERFTGTPLTMMEALLARAEVEEPIAIDVEPLDDPTTIILGIAIAGPAPPATQIRELMNLFNIEAQELQEYLPNAVVPTPLLRFSYQEDLPLTDIPYSDTSAREAGAKGKPHASLKRKTREDVPQEFTFEYTDSSRDNQPNTSNYSVKTAPVANRQKLATSMTFKPEQADVIARQQLWKAINFSDTFEFEALAEYSDLVEGDRINLTGLPDGTDLRGRIVETTRGENGLVEIKGQVDDQLAYSQIAGGGYSGLTEELVDFAPPGILHVLDTSALNAPEASQFGVYIALQLSRATITTTYGIYASFDEVNWFEVFRFSEPAITGSARTVLGVPVGDTHWDEDNTVLVALDNESDLTPLTREEVAIGLNWAFLGGEIIGFTDVAIVEDPDNPHKTVFELSGLLRGRRDTDSYIDEHTVGELFVLLPPSGVGVGFIELDPGRFQQRIFIRSAPQGESVLSAASAETQTEFVPQATTLRPFSVHGVWSIRRSDYSTCVWCTPRTRLPFRLLSGLIPPQVESGDASDYKADVYTLNDAQDDWVLRRQLEGCLSANDQISFQYTRAMIIEDLVDTAIITDPSQVGETLFVIYRESDTIGEGREFGFCVKELGPEFDGVCTIEPPF